MNDKNDLLLIEAMDLITRARGVIDLVRTGSGAKHGNCLLRSPSNTSRAHKQLEVLRVDDRKLRATAS